MNILTLEQRCKLATDCLPAAEYRTRLEQLHAELLDRSQKLDAALDVVVDLGGEVRVPEMEEAKQRRKDAARYRWLRAQVSGHRMLGSAKPASFAFPTTMGLPPLSDIMRGSVAQHLDAAIDEQMRQRAAIDAARGQP